MEEITSLLGSNDTGKDVIDKLISLLDRQTDHKISPNVLVGILGLFNVLTIMSVVRETPGSSIRQVTGTAGNADNAQAQALNDTLGSLMNSQGGGQTDLVSMLSNMAAKKKINPGLLLSLFNMLNQGGSGLNQNTAPQSNSKSAEESQSSATVTSSSPESGQKAEKKTPDDEQNRRHSLEGKRGVGQRS
ncbi:hypothetical protein [Phosphitispora sp. TUW77]|uniref:hypothetical protein n=1 Tax=Phosphitispora sp. TUW77 TaxID=3152361 RepID=UPI003AB5381E